MEFTKEEMKEMKEEIINRTARMLAVDITEEGMLDEKLDTINPAKLAGYLDVDKRTLKKTGIPRVDVYGDGSVFRYRKTQVMDHLKSREEVPNG